jgi:hypothetical protein
MHIAPNLEPAFIRKAISYTKLNKYVRKNITNDCDKWYRENRETDHFFEVVSSLINEEEGRTELYCQSVPQPLLKEWQSEIYYSNLYGMNIRLVQLY